MHNGTNVCRHSRCMPVLSLLTAHLMGQIMSVRVSASFQIIPRLVGQLGSEVRFSVSFQSIAIRMFVCTVMFLPSRLPCHV